MGTKVDKGEGWLAGSTWGRRSDLSRHPFLPVYLLSQIPALPLSGWAPRARNSPLSLSFVISKLETVKDLNS